MKKELVINTQDIKHGLALARKVALNLRFRRYDYNIEAISANAMLQYGADEIELELEKDKYGEPGQSGQPITITKNRVDSLHTLIGINPNILLKAQLQWSKISDKLAEKCESAADTVVQGGECLTAVAELQYAARTSLTRKNSIAECEHRLRYLELKHNQGGKLLLKSPTVEAESLTSHFAQERQLAEKRLALDTYKAKTTNCLSAAKQRAEEIGIPETIQAAALISAWKQVGIPEQNIEVETNGANLVDHAILNIADRIFFAKSK